MKKKIKDLTNREIKRICKKYKCRPDCPLIFYIKDYDFFHCPKTKGYENLLQNIYPEQKEYINEIKEEQEEYLNKEIEI